MTATDQDRSAGRKRLVIVGASGMVGGYALRYALENEAVERVTSIGRRSLGISRPKLKEIQHRDFADCSALADTLLGRDAAVFCLGAYTGTVSDAELRTVTVDYTVEFARARGALSPFTLAPETPARRSCHRDKSRHVHPVPKRLSVRA
jgi:nucleoside-diphosphate-sugar epimerase